jgi:hypothetical protein
VCSELPVDRLIGRLVDVTNGKVQVERARH